MGNDFEQNSSENQNSQVNQNDNINNENSTYTNSQINEGEDGQKETERVTGEIYEAPQYETQDSYHSSPKYEAPQYHYTNQYQNIPPNKEEKKNKSHPVRKLLFVAAGAAVFGLVAGGVFQGVSLVSNFVNGGLAQKEIITQGNNIIEDEKKISTTTVISNPVQPSGDVTAVVENTMPSIVSISSTITRSYDVFGRQYNQNAEGSGSGIIVGKSNKELLIATNNHVVSGADKIAVKFIDEKIAEATVKGTDKAADLAVVAVNLKDIKDSTLGKIKIAVLGDSEQVKVGQMAIAIGNALGYGQSVTVGYISAKDREVVTEDEESAVKNKMVLLQTDAAINPGNSGGALLNLNGEVIGINSVKYADKDVEGMGFAIPISRANPIINELMNREKVAESEKGYLGVEIENVTAEENTKYGMPLGIFVKNVLKKGAAKEAGILAGDIITKVNGMETLDGSSLQEKISSYKVGTEVTLTISRYTNGEYAEREVKVVLKGKNTIEETNKSSDATQTPQDNKEYNYPNGYDNGDFFDDFFNFLP